MTDPTVSIEQAKINYYECIAVFGRLDERTMDALGLVTRCRHDAPPEPPETERVKWWEAVGRRHVNGFVVETVGLDALDSDPFVSARDSGDGFRWTDPDGTVEVLAEAPPTPPAPTEPEGDNRRHSRACGWRKHDHGPACHSNCPTCGGRSLTDMKAAVDPYPPAETAGEGLLRWTIAEVEPYLPKPVKARIRAAALRTTGEPTDG